MNGAAAFLRRDGDGGQLVKRKQTDDALAASQTHAAASLGTAVERRDLRRVKAKDRTVAANEQERFRGRCGGGDRVVALELHEAHAPRAAVLCGQAAGLGQQCVAACGRTEKPRRFRIGKTRDNMCSGTKAHCLDCLVSLRVGAHRVAFVQSKRLPVAADQQQVAAVGAEARRGKAFVGGRVEPRKGRPALRNLRYRIRRDTAQAPATWHC